MKRCRVRLAQRMFACTIALSAACGRIGGNFPPPTPAPTDAAAWEARLCANGGVWPSGPVEMLFRPDGTCETTADSTFAQERNAAHVGGVGAGHWEVHPLDPGRFKIVLTDPQGEVREFELGWESNGAFDGVVLITNGEVVAQVRRPRSR